MPTKGFTEDEEKENMMEAIWLNRNKHQNFLFHETKPYICQ